MRRNFKIIHSASFFKEKRSTRPDETLGNILGQIIRKNPHQKIITIGIHGTYLTYENNILPGKECADERVLALTFTFVSLEN